MGGSPLPGADRHGSAQGRQDHAAPAPVPGRDVPALEDPHVVARIRSDPRSFMEELRRPAILHEIQNTPEIMAHVRTRIDAAFPSCTG